MLGSSSSGGGDSCWRAVTPAAAATRAGEMDKTPLWKVHAAQIVIQLGGAGYYVLAKASLSAGVNSLVFPVYQKLISTCVLAFFSLFTTR